MIEHTYIEFLGLELADPLTFVSDILMASFCAFYGHKLFHEHKAKYAKLASFFFLFLACSSFLGGSSHLFDLYLGKTPHLIAWTVQGVSILLFELASLKLLADSKFKIFLRAAIFAFFGIFISQIFFIQHFDVVKMNTSIGLLGVVSIIHIYKYFQERNRAYLNVPLAIILFAGPALIHSFGINYNKWIDQNVISHILLLPCYYLLYTAVKQVSVFKMKSQLIRQPLPLEEK
ncbi:hypothetical protein QYS48_31165 [Marivirga arenosa]|uniref:Uncharacterized protein n=1 Tax=Marivirga arenosa TaxID=3059076 RepID=A0AA51R9P6_9BACT|nr:hypothetical protein [Marivirga sp. ABR2-2]WMN05978.1 hypothetical protein QYS48_31165 [Marivirga sp. ABR2-2]